MGQHAHIRCFILSPACQKPCPFLTFRVAVSAGRVASFLFQVTSPPEYHEYPSGHSMVMGITGPVFD